MPWILDATCLYSTLLHQTSSFSLGIEDVSVMSKMLFLGLAVLNLVILLSEEASI